MPAHVQISLLRRMQLLPGGAVMTLSAILLTTSELTSLLHEYDIQIKLLIENKLIIRALGNLHYRISREKQRFESRFWFKFFSGDLIM